MGAKCLTVRRGVQAPLPLWEVEETREIRFSRSHIESKRGREERVYCRIDVRPMRLPIA